jgi:hypothetical protein
MQQSIVWLPGEAPGGGAIVATALDGTLRYLDPSALAAGPVRTVSGHAEPMVALEVERGSGAIVSACAGGRVCVWGAGDEARSAYSATALGGAHAPTKRCAGVAVAGGLIAVVAWDDKLRTGTLAPPALTGTVALGAQPRAVAASAA